MPEETNTQLNQGRRNGKWKNQQSQNQGSSGLNMESAKETAKEAFNTVSDKASEYVNQASGYIRGFNASPNQFIRQYPMQAALGGVVIGFLLGAAVSRRSIA